MPRACAAAGSSRDERAPADRDGAAIGRFGAGHDLDQRRLAGAVLANQRVDFARANIERDAIERAGAGERLGDGLSREQDGVHGRPDDRGWCRHRQGAKAAACRGATPACRLSVGQIGKVPAPRRPYQLKRRLNCTLRPSSAVVMVPAVAFEMFDAGLPKFTLFRRLNDLGAEVERAGCRPTGSVWSPRDRRA